MTDKEARAFIQILFDAYKERKNYKENKRFTILIIDAYIKYVKNGNITTTNNDLFNKSNNFQAINQTKKNRLKNSVI